MNDSSKFKVQSSKLTPGFTLIELLVVISILGLLAGLVISNVSGVRERARDVERKSDLDQVKKALRMYYNDNDAYPPNGEVIWGSAFSSGETVYMKVLPQDPNYNEETGVPEYSYEVSESGQDFCLQAGLENASDSDIVKSQSRCSESCGDVGDDIYVVCAD